MRRSRSEVDSRRHRLAELIREEQFLSVADVCDRLDVSEATARRDLRILHQQEKIQRTTGGALAGYDNDFRSFRERLGQRESAKRQLAERALTEVAEGMTLFLDGGTTMFHIARALAERGWSELTVYTNNLPVAEVLSRPGVRTLLTGGQFLSHQSVLLGPVAEATMKKPRLDLSFLGAEGMTTEGIWNSQEDLTRFQRAVMGRSHRHFFVLDRSKLGHRTTALLCEWPAVDGLLTDASEAELAKHRISHSKAVASR